MAAELSRLEFEDPAEYDPLTDWENEPTVEDLKQDLTSARSSHSSHVSDIDRWLDNLHVRGSAKPKKSKGRSSIQPKLIRKQAEWRYAALSEPFLSNEDMFETAPVSWEDKKAAQQNALVLNNQFNTKIDKVSFVDEYVRTAVNEGTVIVRVGWDFEEREEEVEEPVMGLRPITDPEKAAEMMQQGLAPLEEYEESTRTVRKMVTIKNQPTAEVCDYNNVIVDPTCGGDFAKANFIVFEFETSLSELEKAGKYQNLDKIEVDKVNALAADDSTVSEGTESGFKFKDKPRQRFMAREYWGYWDKDGDGITRPIVATWVGNVMIRMEDNPFPDRSLPFVAVAYLPKRKSVYGEPDGELLEDNQRVLGAVTRGMVDIMGRTANGQTGYRQDALDVTNERRYEMGLDYKFQPHIDPKQAFHTHTFAEIPNSAQFMVELQNFEAESLSGVKAFHQGITGSGYGDTATGARGAMDAAGKREMGILRRLKQGMVDIGRKFMAMNAEFLDEEETIRLTNEEFVTVRRDDLGGKMDIRLNIATYETENIKAQELAFMLQTMGNNMPPEMSQMILADIARLRKMPELAKRITEYQPEPDPIAQENAMLENELLKAKIAHFQAQAGEREAEGLFEMAKAQETQIKARLLNSQADMSDLDFVEQESGVKQERDLEKQGAQAKAQMNTKIAEALMKGAMGQGSSATGSPS